MAQVDGKGDIDLISVLDTIVDILNDTIEEESFLDLPALTLRAMKSAPIMRRRVVKTTPVPPLESSGE